MKCWFLLRLGGAVATRSPLTAMAWVRLRLLPCTPPAMHTPCHACPLPYMPPCHTPPPHHAFPLPCRPFPCHATPPLPSTPPSCHAHPPPYRGGSSLSCMVGGMHGGGHEWWGGGLVWQGHACGVFFTLHSQCLVDFP